MKDAERRWDVRHVRAAERDAVVDVEDGAEGVHLVVWDEDVPRGALWLPAAELPLTVADALVRLPRPASPSTPLGEDLREPCTVVVCTRGRAGSLARCLDSLAALDPPATAVVVVDNGPDDPGVREVVAGRPGITYVAEPRPGLDIARNAGWRRARTALVAYTDDDVVVHRRWLGALVEAFDAPHVVAATGLVLPATLETRAQQDFERHWSFGRGFASRDFGPEFYASTRARGAPAWELGAGASMAFRRDFLAASGGFDERLDAGAAGCSGDSEMWYRVLADGLVCRYTPASVCFHEHRRDRAALRAQVRAYMRGHVAALLVQYARYGERGNLRRVLLTLPASFARRAVARTRGPRRTAGADSSTLLPEVLGALGGVVYCLRDPVWRTCVRHRARTGTA